MKYIKPTVEIFEISTVDVINTSGEGWDITVSDEGEDKWTNGYY